MNEGAGSQFANVVISQELAVSAKAEGEVFFWRAPFSDCFSGRAKRSAKPPLWVRRARSGRPFSNLAEGAAASFGVPVVWCSEGDRVSNQGSNVGQSGQSGQSRQRIRSRSSREIVFGSEGVCMVLKEVDGRRGGFAFLLGRIP